jgi:hypothetical protein
MKNLISFDLHPIYSALLALTLLVWALTGYFLFFEPTFNSLPILIWAALGITMLAGTWRWQKERINSRTLSPEAIISQIGGPLVSWNWRKDQLNKTVHDYAIQTALNDFGIKSVGQVLNLASHSPFGSVIASGWAIKRKWHIYEKMPSDLALYLLGTPESPPAGFSLAASGSAEMLDLALNYLLENVISESFDDIVSHALEGVIQDVTLGDLIPFIGPIKSGGLAYVYTWIVGFIYLAVLFNYSLASELENEQIDEQETQALVAASRELLRDHILQIGPLKVPVPWKSVELERVLTLEDIQAPLNKKLIEMTHRIREDHPHLTRAQVIALYERANFPPIVLEKLSSEGNWRKSQPNVIKRVQHAIWL